MRKEILSSKPFLINIPFGYYKSHTVTAVGYEVYEKEHLFWSDEERFIEVYYGWSSRERYIHYEKLNFASITTINVKD